MESAPSQLPFPVTRIGAGARDRDLPSSGSPIAFLPLSSRSYYRIPAGAKEIMLGSDPARTDLTISGCPEVSGQHLLVHVEDDHVYVSDLRSTNGTRIHGRPSRRGAVRCGERVAVAGYEVVVLSHQMQRYLEELTLYVGRTEHLHQLLTLSPTQHLILIGAHHTPLEEIAR